MRITRTVAACAVATLIAGTVGAIPVGGAGALTAATVTVTPDTDLIDGQSVQVSVVGVEPSSETFTTLCSADTVQYERCADGLSRGGTTAADGTLTFAFGLEAKFNLSAGGSVDCRTGTGCVLVTGVYDDEGASALTKTPLAFRADGPLLPPPTITLTPANDFVDGSVVHVNGSGFIGGAGVSFVQCRSPFQDADDCESATAFASADATGNLTADVDLTAIMVTNNGNQVDCRVAACVLLATGLNVGSDPTREGTAPLVFRPDGPLRPPPVMAVDPSAGLVDGQEVHVSGTGFRPGTLVFAECGPGDGQLFDRCPDLQFASIDADGVLSAPLPVKVLTRTGTGFADCRLTQCTISTLDINAQRVLATAPIAFDPNGPDPTLPTVTIAPTGTLPTRSTVHVTGSGFGAFDFVDVQQCVIPAGGVAPTECSSSGGDPPQADANGALAFDTVVTNIVGSGDGAEIDCSRVTCGLVVGTFDRYPGIAPLTFAPTTGPARRYYDPVFTDVDVTEGVVYRHTTTPKGVPVDLKLDVYRPAGDTATKRPAVMWMFGGYFGSGDRTQLADHARAMALRGYVSITIDYRTRPDIFSSGPDGCVPVGGACLDVTQLGPAIIDARDDARAAMVWLHDHAADYGIEPRAISTAGWSAGAITSLNLAHDATGDRPAASIPAAAVSLAGILTSTPHAADPPSLMMGGNHDSLLAIGGQVAGCGIIRTSGSSCDFVEYTGAKPDPTTDACVTQSVPCTYVLGRDAEHGFLFGERPDVVARMSSFLAQKVLMPLGLVPGGGTQHHHPPHHHHHHGHHQHGWWRCPWGRGRR